MERETPSLISGRPARCGELGHKPDGEIGNLWAMTSPEELGISPEVLARLERTYRTVAPIFEHAQPMAAMMERLRPTMDLIQSAASILERHHAAEGYRLQPASRQELAAIVHRLQALTVVSEPPVAERDAELSVLELTPDAPEDITQVELTVQEIGQSPQFKRALQLFAQRSLTAAGIVQATPNRAVPSNTLMGVSCTSGTFCMAVGMSGPLEALAVGVTSRPLGLKAQRLAAKPAPTMMLAERWDGTRWRIEPTPHPTGSPANFFGPPLMRHWTQSRARRQGCARPLAGWALLTSAVTVADHWNGRKWTLELTPSLTGTLQHTFAGVWCGAHIACRAAGSVEMASGDLQTLVERR